MLRLTITFVFAGLIALNSNLIAVSQTNQCPTARLSASPTTIAPQGTVHFNACSSSDPDGSVVSYWFDYGDGFDSGWTSSCTDDWSYTDAGTYYAKVKVRDNAGCISAWSSSVQISVASASPVPDLVSVSGIPSSVQSGNSFTVQITAENDGGASQEGAINASVLYGDGSDDVTVDNASASWANVLKVLRPGQGPIWNRNCQQMSGGCNGPTDCYQSPDHRRGGDRR